MKPLQLTLSVKESEELTQMLKSHPKAHMRKRASALLQIAGGKSGRWVAAHGLLQKRRKHTVYDWVKSYKAAGIKGLGIKEGRGRKPSFFPSEQITS